jgi:hypothetical protein
VPNQLIHILTYYAYKLIMMLRSLQCDEYLFIYEYCYILHYLFFIIIIDRYLRSTQHSDVRVGVPNTQTILACVNIFVCEPRLRNKINRIILITIIHSNDNNNLIILLN